MYVIAAVFGLIVGSFLTVCVHRIPFGREKGPPEWEEEETPEGVAEGGEADTPLLDEEKGEEPPHMSIVSPSRSICPACGKQLLWWHNIPLFSWLLLRGKCGFCKAPISIRYPLIEAISALLAVLSVVYFGPTPTAVLVYAFACALVVISFIDIDYYIIPDVISLPGVVLGVLISLVNQFTGVFAWPVVPGIVQSLVGLVFGGGVLLLISEVYFRLRHRVGLGMGDIKLLAMTGAFFGLEGAMFTMFVGSLVGSIIGIFLMVCFRKKLTYQLPFGPYLALGTLLYFFAAESFMGFRGFFFPY